MLHSPNFLRPWQYIYKREPVAVTSVLLILLLLTISVILYVVTPILGYIVVGVSLFLLGIVKIEYLFYALISVSFFHGWEIDFGDYNFTRGIPYINTVNAPLSDFLAIFLLFSLFFSWIFGFKKLEFKKLKKIWPVFLAYAVFLLIAFISTRGAYDGSIVESTTYWLRPLIFVSIVYLILPILLIKDKKTFMNVLYLWFGVGLLVSFYGFMSLIVDPSVGWTRVHPFALWKGFTPLGINHNVIAEPLVMIIPIGIYLWYQQKKNWIAFATLFMLVIALGTLSRAAWLALLVSFVAFVYIYRKQMQRFVPKNILSVSLIVATILLPIVLYMSIFLTSGTVKSSNYSRWELTDMAVFYTLKKPLIGYGPGSFVNIVKDNYLFRSEFGDPLDSHGIIQKLLVEEGVLGLVAFSVFIFFILWYTWRAMKNVKTQDNKYLLATLFVMMLGSLTFQLFNTSYFLAVLWLPLGISLTTTIFYLNYVERKKQ
ncbi:MAG: O-antigen ligase family protein [Candidatus Magasanikbacteria bacterium]|uniref:O-antigen ligase-related domain-containing protein n=1 Tax=Candidatus Magasanikbacteria bacterium CG_4_10_14_0_2_um_filter_33_14 TaxID=1974636 RepID=A0A2M7VAU3_9BACT|nr:O-antigen ligase family protein [Candidatus Magasanikbacteria bacterium]PIZ96010.1 MAG: hypothetical protein COX80_02645 [Candidatus Magasanikbacteria bacterium CG_4_10_14_0_2_um_filter_33_14]